MSYRCAYLAVALASSPAWATSADEVPERWSSVAFGDDRSGDLRASAVALLDAIAEASVAVSVADARALGLVAPVPAGVSFAPPTSIRIWRRGLDGSTASCLGRVDVIPFDQYVKGVLPHEWIRSWHSEALKAGAVAIRSYAAAWVEAGGKYDCADLDDTTASQVYRDEFFSQTDAAVDATAGVFVVRDGAVVFAEYSAENGDPPEMGVTEPLCTGRARSGHGRGICQWGTQRWAQDGQTWAWMTTHYYPGATPQSGWFGPVDDAVTWTITVVPRGDAGVEPAAEPVSGGCGVVEERGAGMLWMIGVAIGAPVLSRRRRRGLARRS